METQELSIRKDFIELLSNLTFNITFHNEKYPKGKLYWIEEHGEWRFDKFKPYYNFDIDINGYKLENVLETWEENKYGAYLEEKLKIFIESNLFLPSLSTSDRYDLLISEQERLNYMNSQYYTERLKDQFTHAFWYDVLWNHKINIVYLNTQGAINVKNDRFLMEFISYFASRQVEVIKSTIKLIKGNLKLPNMRTEDIAKSIITENNPLELMWNKSDTDLLELVTALIEMKAINNNQNNLTSAYAG